MKKNNQQKYPLMIVIIGVVGVICILLGLWRNPYPMVWAKGVLFGTIFTMIKWVLMKNTITKAVDMHEAKARNYTMLHYGLRYLLTVIVLAVAALEPSISLMGTFVGLLTMKVATYVLLLLGKTDSI